MRAERLAERRPGRRGAHGIQRDRQRPETERAEELEEHFEDFGLRGRAGNPEELDADLRELPKAPGLRPLVPELRPDVVQAQRHRTGGEPVLDHGPDYSGRIFRAHRQRAALTVGERVHLLVDDVGRLADGPLEERGVFQHGRADLGVPPRSEGLARDPLRLRPALALRRKEVARPLDRPVPQSHGAIARRPSIRKYSSLYWR